MTSVMQRHLRTAAALGALGLAFASVPAYANGTAAGTSINNTASVSYSVGSVAQPAVASNQSTFVVDRLVNYTLTTQDATFVSVTPGQTTGFVTYLLTHLGNDNEGFALSTVNAANGTTVFTGTDNADVTALAIYVAPNDTAVFVPSAPTSNGYVQATSINTVAPAAAGAPRRIVVMATAPNSLANQAIAGVQLTARAAVSGTNGATLETATVGADTAGVDTVIQVAGNTLTATSGFRVNAPIIAVTKSAVVIDDPINATTNPKAIPGATIEYRVVAVNSGATAAQSVGFSDTLDAATAFQVAAYGATANVQIIQNSVTTTCLAEAGGADTNGDGCVLNGAVLNVVPTGAGAVTLATSGANATAEFRFQVKIN